MEAELASISNIIHLAIAPAFLLVGIGTQMRVLINRLGRIIDRSRILEQRLRTDGDEPAQAINRKELEYLFRRMRLIHYAVTLSTSCALLTGVVIVALFVSGTFGLRLDHFIALVFVASMVALIGSFICFLREIFIATETLPLSLRRKLKKR